MRYYSPVEESFLAVFIRVWCRSVVSYNVPTLCDGVEKKVQMLGFVPKLKNRTKDEDRTTATLLQNVCYGQYGLLIRNYQNQNENK
jgi:hypothetical protein